MKNNDVIITLGALAQESRLEVFRLLVRKGVAGMAAAELSDHSTVYPVLFDVLQYGADSGEG